VTGEQEQLSEANRASEGAGPHRAWLIDLDGTLYKPLLVKLAMGAELALLGGSRIAAIRSFRKQHELVREQADELVPSPFECQLERAASEAGLSVDALRTIVAEWMVERPGKWIRAFRRGSLLREIAAFRAAGGKTSIVSDYPASSKLSALGADSLFDCVVSNGEPGGPSRLKPWPDGYLLAAKRLGVAPSECLVIGDREDADGRAAASAGMDFRLIS